MKKVRSNTMLSAVAGLAILATSPLAFATLIYSENFDGLTAGSAPGAPYGGGTTGGGHSLVTAADANYSSQYLEITSRQDNGNFNFAFYDSSLTTALTSDVATFSFDGRFNTADYGTYGRFRLRPRGGTAANGTFDVARADIGNSGPTPTLDAVNHYDFAVNNTASAAAIEGLGGTLAANSWAIYENGALFSSGSNQAGAPAGAINYLTLWVQGNTAGTGTPSAVRIDNFEVRDNAFVQIIPEPASIALLGLGALVAGLHRRRRMK